MSDADEQSNTDPLADTVGPPPTPFGEHPSSGALRQRVYAQLFEGAPKTSSDYEAGTVLAGRYRIVGLLGRGGMGEVYRARDLVLDEDVAIKFIPQELAHDSRFMDRFVQEVRLARVVSHANVCRVHDIGELDGRSYLSMEYIDGEDLASLLRRIGRLPSEKATELARQLCAGLAALHEHDILHRDLKPHNLMVDGRGHLKITDFGLAARGQVAVSERRDGTPAYMAPEQAEGRDVNERSDLFALGLILYEIFTGDRARTADSDDSALSSKLTSHASNMPPEVMSVIEACLQVDPSARPSSALAVAAALPGGDPIEAALAAGRAPSVDVLLSADVGGRLPRLWGSVMAIVAVVVLLVLTATFNATTYLGQHPSLPPQVLRHQANELLNATAGPLEATYDYRSLRYDTPLLGERQDDLHGAPLVLFNYRRQATPFVPLRRVSMDDPQYLSSGASRVTLDSDGRLRSLFISHSPRDENPSEVDWAPLFEAAGIERDALHDAEPRDIPRFDVDEVFAWTGNHESWDAEIRVEAASRGGKIVSFDVLPQWDPHFEDSPTDPRNDVLLAYATVVGVLLLFGGLAWLSRRAMLLHAVDARGAFRVATAVGIFSAVLVVFDRNLLSGNSFRLSQNLAAAVGSTLLTYWGYVALEPFARRYAPGAMTSWVRLVRGRFRDPLVAREVLIAVSASIAAVGIERVGATLDGSLTLHPASLENVDTLNGLLWSISGSMGGAPIVFLLYVGLVRLIRNRTAASWVFVLSATLIFTAIWLVNSSSVLHSLAMGVSGFFWASVIVRVGLLGLVAFQLARTTLFMLPLSLDTSAWFSYVSFSAIAMLLALIAYGWHFGVQRQRTST